jgi:hypothetical protein
MFYLKPKIILSRSSPLHIRCLTFLKNKCKCKNIYVRMFYLKPKIILSRSSPLHIRCLTFLKKKTHFFFLSDVLHKCLILTLLRYYLFFLHLPIRHFFFVFVLKVTLNSFVMSIILHH